MVVDYDESVNFCIKHIHLCVRDYVVLLIAKLRAAYIENDQRFVGPSAELFRLDHYRPRSDWLVESPRLNLVGSKFGRLVQI